MADVVAVAKRDLKRGDVLDGGGGFTVNGVIEKAETAHEEDLLPLGLASGLELQRDVPLGAGITYGAVELNEDSFVLQMRREQDAGVD